MIILRPIEPSEVRYVQSTWSRDVEPKSFVHPHDAERWGRKVPRSRKWVRVGPRSGEVAMSLPSFRRAHALLVDDAIAKSTIVVAAMANVPEEPIGWVAFDVARGALHYVFVADYARRHGVGRKLLLAALQALGPDHHMTHETAAGSRLLASLATAGLDNEDDSDGPHEENQETLAH